MVRIAGQDVGVLTPFRVSTAGPTGAVLLSLIYDTLTWKDDRGIVPWLASSWEVSPDGRDYTFTLAPNVRWHDGQPLTADDVAFSFDLYRTHPYRWMPLPVGVRATVLGADRVRLELDQPFAPFLENVAGIVPILPRHVWERVADPEHYDGADASIGSGPYRLAEYRAADGAYRLLANSSYYKGAPTVAEVQQLNVPAETALQALQQGQIELAQTADASIVDLLKDSPRLKVLETAPLSVVRLAINTQQPPLDQVDVRRVLAYALDRNSIGRTITRGAPVPGSDGVIPPETPWFSPSVTQYPFDAAAARALIGNRSIDLELLANTTYREPELLQPMLQDVGIQLTLKRVDGPTKTQLLQDGHFQLAELQHIGVGGDPDYLRQWALGQESNESAQGFVLHDAAFLTLAQQQAATLDVNSRKEIVGHMQQLLADELPTIPLYYRRFYWIYDSASVTPMNTWGGLMNGIPFVLNKLIFLPH
jgi:peptide/nickel transport system substrate-binding protein